eukprot:TRINITY_DN5854_c0_g1_i1.p1 TRINITY_DN5854_c0_g1~~TRINITY_DN5854_c0_g1_i1.p1  ORF type:complete len:712 (+),score=193.03 TRINITY_DN5854_c0_g1_i1:150-2138(+)
MRCICCKSNEAVIISHFTDKPFDFYNTEELFSLNTFNMHFVDKDMFEQASKFGQLRCPQCVEDDAEPLKFHNFQKLQQHTMKAHNKRLCRICFENRKVFSHEQRLYTQKQLSKHIAHGDPLTEDDCPIPAHPMCRFCRSNHFNQEILDKHYDDKHMNCDVCKRLTGSPNIFRDYNALFRHFKDKHYICEMPECLEQHFVVFADELELQSHFLEVHGSQMTKQQRKQVQRIDLTSFIDTEPEIPTRRMDREEREEFSRRNNDRRRRRGRDRRQNSPAPPTHTVMVDSETRDKNNQLMALLKESFGTEEQLQRFKSMSAEFRTGELSARGFLAMLRATVPMESQLTRISQLLIDLCPEATKQEEMKIAFTSLVCTSGPSNRSMKRMKSPRTPPTAVSKQTIGTVLRFTEKLIEVLGDIMSIRSSDAFPHDIIDAEKHRMLTQCLKRFPLDNIIQFAFLEYLGVTVVAQRCFVEGIGSVVGAPLEENKICPFVNDEIVESLNDPESSESQHFRRSMFRVNSRQMTIVSRFLQCVRDELVSRISSNSTSEPVPTAPESTLLSSAPDFPGLHGSGRSNSSARAVWRENGQPKPKTDDFPTLIAPKRRAPQVFVPKEAYRQLNQSMRSTSFQNQPQPLMTNSKSMSQKERKQQRRNKKKNQEGGLSLF